MKKYFLVLLILLFFFNYNLFAQEVMSSNPRREKINAYSREFEMMFDKKSGFPIEIFNAPLLEIVSIIACDLENIPRDIEYLKELKVLNFNHNKLTTIPNEINTLTKLLYLNLSSNKLIQLPSELSNLQVLEELDLGGNEFTAFPKSICQIKSLKRLNLDYNYLQNVPNEIDKLVNLKNLALNLDSINKFPKQIFSLKKLEQLELQGARNLSFSGISKLTELNSLSCPYSTFKTFPKAILKLKKLKTLHFFQSNIVEIPKQIEELNELETLDLRNNQVKNLPVELAKLKYLKELKIDDNPINIEDLKKIRVLLPNCKIDIFDDNRTYYSYGKKGRYDIACLLLDYKTQKEQLNYHYWYSLSWYSLFINKPKDAINSALRVLEIDANQLSVESNLALGYLLNNQWEDAEKIYKKWQSKTFPNNTKLCDTIFLNDIDELRKAGIKHKDFDKAIKLLK